MFLIKIPVLFKDPQNLTLKNLLLGMFPFRAVKIWKNFFRGRVLIINMAVLILNNSVAKRKRDCLEFEKSIF